GGGMIGGASGRGSGFVVSDLQLPIGEPIANHQLPIANHQLPIAKTTFDPVSQRIYFRAVDSSSASANLPDVEAAPTGRWLICHLESIGRKIIRFLETAHGLIAFTLIALGVGVTKFNASARVIRPLIRLQIHRAGLRLLPMVSFLACALGLMIIGQ